MKIKDITLEIRTEDGVAHMINFDTWEFSKDGSVYLAGKLVQSTWKDLFGEDAALECGHIYNVTERSALVRFMCNETMRNAAITHITTKAIRMINLDLGVTWIPKHIVRWSNIAQQFVVIDEDYKFDFTTDVVKGMDTYPPQLEIDEDLIEQITNK